MAVYGSECGKPQGDSAGGYCGRAVDCTVWVRFGFVEVWCLINISFSIMEIITLEKKSSISLTVTPLHLNDRGISRTRSQKYQGCKVKFKRNHPESQKPSINDRGPLAEAVTSHPKPCMPHNQFVVTNRESMS